MMGQLQKFLNIELFLQCFVQGCKPPGSSPQHFSKRTILVKMRRICCSAAQENRQSIGAIEYTVTGPPIGQPMTAAESYWPKPGLLYTTFTLILAPVLSPTESVLVGFSLQSFGSVRETQLERQWSNVWGAHTQIFGFPIVFQTSQYVWVFRPDPERNL